MKLNLESYEMEENKNVKTKGKFINRELSWIDFNKRVLDCISRDIPMNEKLNFIGITGSNLDEFISVRFANAFKHQNTEPYKEILKRIKGFMKIQDAAFSSLRKDLEKNYKLHFVKPKDLSKKEKEKLSEVFEESIFPLLTPINLTSSDINIISGTTYIISIIKSGSRERVTIIPLINKLDQLWVIDKKVLFLEDIILFYMEDKIFINQEISSKGVFRIIKDASVILSHDERKFIIERMEETLKRRVNSNPLFLEIREDVDDRIKNLLPSIFKIPTGHICTRKILDYKIFSKERILTNDSYKKFIPFDFDTYDNYYSIFDCIDHKDILLHHPYDSYDTVIKFIQHAAMDPQVESIKQTLYRVSGIDSPIVEALCNAAENGKFVTVLVEIKARFDEENNLHLVTKLQKHGVNVILGNEFLKTHCKLCIITRKVNDKLRIYSHVATGNYNEKTAKIYTDLSYFTSKQKVGIDLLYIFNILSGYSKPDERLNKVFYAPVNLRKQLEKCIDREIKYAKKGNKAEIFIKVNSISDIKMVNKIYEAANAGVHIQIICRGVCSLVPRKNLEIKSIVGRFLEHSRIYYFRNNKNPEYYISSADLLTRNLDRRVETLISLKDSNVIDELKWIISIMKNDCANSYIETPSGNWVKAKGSFDAHVWLMEYSDIKYCKKNSKKK